MVSRICRSLYVTLCTVATLRKRNYYYIGGRKRNHVPHPTNLQKHQKIKRFRNVLQWVRVWVGFKNLSKPRARKTQLIVDSKWVRFCFTSSWKVEKWVLFSPTSSMNGWLSVKVEFSCKSSSWCRTFVRAAECAVQHTNLDTKTSTSD